jgi:hypothetical protein
MVGGRQDCHELGHVLLPLRAEISANGWTPRQSAIALMISSS